MQFARLTTTTSANQHAVPPSLSTAGGGGTAVCEPLTASYPSGVAVAIPGFNGGRRQEPGERRGDRPERPMRHAEPGESTGDHDRISLLQRFFDILGGTDGGEVSSRAATVMQRMEKSLRDFCHRHLERRLGELRELDTLRLQARRDPLTGLANRRRFTEVLQREENRVARYGHPLSLIVFDIDFFKQVNDTYGHPAGDKVLAEVSRCLEEHIRSTDIACRIGGEEFAVVLPNTHRRAAGRLAERLRRGIAARGCAVDRQLVIRVTASFGVAGLESATATIDDQDAAARDAGTTSPITLLAAADLALYDAKRAGRNRVCSAAGNTPASPVAGSGKAVVFG
ncbi:MAG: GGDEF domain-containing protein [Deltaproteobacteria bacterium]|nr:GGDEF domain-containing protein [Candidatus Anaeroferrophillacea bacterium]